MADVDTDIVPGAPVVVTLHSPREKLWGILLKIDPCGVFVRGIELNTFDNWIALVSKGEPNVGFTSLFLPMWRVDKIFLDESMDDIRSLADQFTERVGMSPEQFFQASRR